jgi:predicted nucleotidyltransferase
MSIFSQYHVLFLKSLLEYDVKFLIVGGQAAIYHGVRRGTGDLDLLVEPTKENGIKILKAFKKLSLQAEDLKPEEFEGTLFLGLGFEPDAVDIFTHTEGVHFETAYEQAVEITDSGLKIRLISIENLIKNKESLNRNETKKILDQYDIQVLKKILKERE